MLAKRRSAKLGPLRAACVVGALLMPGPAHAHPHVFVDGGVDFVLGEDLTLQALRVTWQYDSFETLYMLAENGLTLTPEGSVTENDRQKLVERLSDWPADFDGSAHPSVDGAPVALDWPSEVDARVEDGRLEKSFTRTLAEPLPMAGRQLTVSFHERTYFFAFSVTRPPQVTGDDGRCTVEVLPFEEDSQSDDLAATLAALGREETPKMRNVGALFADRIVLTCD